MRPVWPAVVLLALLVVLAAGHAVAERALRLEPTKDLSTVTQTLARKVDVRSDRVFISQLNSLK